MMPNTEKDALAMRRYSSIPAPMTRGDLVWNTAIDDVLGEKSMTGLAVRDTITGETEELPFTGLFLAIGHDPRSELVKGQLDLDEDGYVKVAAPSTHTNIPGVFACGDVVDHIYRQAITAAGTGCAAALDAERYIADLQGHPDDAPEAPAPPVGESVVSLAASY